MMQPNDRMKHNQVLRMLEQILGKLRSMENMIMIHNMELGKISASLEAKREITESDIIAAIKRNDLNG